MPLTFGSLFSGIGGFDLGFERAGMVCKWQCEIDAKASLVLAHHWPNVPNIGDVKNVRRDTVEAVDVICGGFPCQDVSVAGKRAGLAGDRSGLWFEFHRVLDELKPCWVVIENVPGLLSSNRGRDFATIIRGLVKFGYGVCWRVLDAQHFGVPQRRRRVFIVGSLGDGRSAEVLFEREGGTGNTTPGGKSGKVAPTIPASGAGTSRTGNSRTESDMLVLARSLRASGINSGSPERSDQTLIIDTTGYQGDNVVMGDGLWPSLPAQGGNNGGGAGAILFDYRKYGHENPTLLADHGPADSRPGSAVRRLTPVECERLQGFPDGWTDGQADSARCRQLGNAVAVPCAEWIGHRIVQIDNERTRER